MSEETTNQAGTTPAVTSATTNDATAGSDDVEALKKHNKALLTELTNKKGELNDYKGKYETLQSEKEAREAEKLAEQGEYKKLLEQEQAKNQSFQKQVLKAQLQAYAFKEGILDDDLIDVIPTDKIKITAVNDSIQIAGAEEAVKAYKASKPHLFKVLDAVAAAGTTSGATKPVGGQATGAAVADPSSAGNTTNAVANGVKPGSKEARELEAAYKAKYNR